MEDLDLMVRTSERSTFKQCRQKWWWSYVDCLDPARSGPALTFGSLVHEALAGWYLPGTKRGLHPGRTFVRSLKAWEAEHDTILMVKESKDGDESKSVRAMDLGIAMLKGYVQEYGNDEWIEVISSEMPFETVVTVKGKPFCRYVGTFDAAIRDLRTGRCGIFEHKTTATREIIRTPLALEEQGGSYWAYGEDFLRSIGVFKDESDTLDFILYNGLRKGFPDQRHKNAQGFALNKDGSVSKKQPVPLFMRQPLPKSAAQRNVLMDRVEAEVVEIDMARRGKLKIYKNPAEHCNWCGFRDMCEVHEVGSDWQSMRDELFNKRDPYSDHLEDL